MIGIDAVLFDLFETLVTVDSSRLPSVSLGDRTAPSTIPAILTLLRSATPAVSDADAIAAFAATRARPPVLAEPDAEIPEHHFFAALLLRLGIADPDDAFARRLADAQMAAIVAACRPMPGARLLLANLRRRGLRTAVVSNLAHAPSLDALLAIADPEHRFDAAVASIEVGFCKPDGRPFRLALARLDMPARRTMHLGDDPVGDVIGATREGIQAVWFNPSGRAWPGADAAPATVSSFEEVEALLGNPKSSTV